MIGKIALIFVLVFTWLIGSATLATSFHYASTDVNGKVVGTIKQYQGDNAPYEVLNVTTDTGQILQVTVSCDYYSQGSQIQIRPEVKIWLFWPFASFDRPTILQNAPPGCTHT